jgi:hypothetical protein
VELEVVDGVGVDHCWALCFSTADRGATILYVDLGVVVGRRDRTRSCCERVEEPPASRRVAAVGGVAAGVRLGRAVCRAGARGRSVRDVAVPSVPVVTMERVHCYQIQELECKRQSRSRPKPGEGHLQLWSFIQKVGPRVGAAPACGR